MSALSDWSKALWEQLQDCQQTEFREIEATAWEIIEEAAQRLILETRVERDEWWKARGHSDDC